MLPPRKPLAADETDDCMSLNADKQPLIVPSGQGKAG